MGNERALRGAASRRKVGWWLLGAVLATCWTLAAAPPSEAISRQKAQRIALKKLKPRKQPGSIVFGLPTPVARGAMVFEAGAPKPHRFKVKPLRRRAWLFWQDLAAGARYAHPSVLLLLNRRTGKVIKKQRLHWILYINKRRAPFLRTLAAYNGGRFRVYPRGGAASASAGDGPEPAAGYPTIAKRTEKLKHDCLITVGDFADPIIKGDRVAMSHFAEAVGLKHYPVAHGSASNLDDTVDTAVRNKCFDVFIEVSGHGVPPRAEDFAPGLPKQWWSLAGAQPVNAQNPGGAAAVNVGTHEVINIGDFEVTNKSEYITPEDLIELAKKYDAKGVDFKIKVDACFADRFAPVFHETDNVRVLETASYFDEVSLGGGNPIVLHPADPITHQYDFEADNIPNADNPDGAGSFTNRDVHGLFEWAATAPEDSTLLDGIIASFDLGAAYDDAANANWTHPQRRTRAPRAVCDSGPSLQVSPFTVGLDSYELQLTAFCPGGLIQGLFDTRITALGGKQIFGYTAHTNSSSCGSLPTTTITCEVKPDGRVCIHLHLNPAGAAGDQASVELRDADATPLWQGTLTAPAGTQPPCPI